MDNNNEKSQSYEAFRCKTCGTMPVVIADLKNGAGLQVFCSNDRCPDIKDGIIKPFLQLKVQLVQVKPKEAPQGATKIPNQNPMRQ
jgi:hypothetical protein